MPASLPGGGVPVHPSSNLSTPHTPLPKSPDRKRRPPGPLVEAQRAAVLEHLRQYHARHPGRPYDLECVYGHAVGCLAATRKDAERLIDGLAADGAVEFFMSGEYLCVRAKRQEGGVP
jgi:hypothetical protein